MRRRVRSGGYLANVWTATFQASDFDNVPVVVPSANPDMPAGSVITLQVKRNTLG